MLGATLAGPTLAVAGNGFAPIWKHVKSKLSKPGTINRAKNPVDWTRLKNLPADFADGVDDAGAGGGLGAITVRTENNPIPGGQAHNSKYVLDYVEMFCEPGEIALSGNGYFGGNTLNGGTPGDDDDLEVFIAGTFRTDDGMGNQGYRVWGGNDSGSQRNLIVQVVCMAA
ncbi:MAG TPA: hypothetical protein VF129_12470 [Actinomycetota bacterium]